MARNFKLLSDEPPRPYILTVDGSWELLELSSFGRQYVEVYSVIYALQAVRPVDPTEDQFRWALRAFPWKGGWSSVSFFQSVVAVVPAKLVPRIVRINYASPGEIQLLLAVTAALRLKHIVDSVCSIAERVNAAYDTLHKSAQERKLLTLDVKRREREFTRDELKFAANTSEELLILLDMQELRYNRKLWIAA